jgi:hypothetical protein
MAEEFKSHEVSRKRSRPLTAFPVNKVLENSHSAMCPPSQVKEEIRAGLARIQGMLPGTTGDFLQSKRKEYFANFVTQDDLAAFFNEG